MLPVVPARAAPLPEPRLALVPARPQSQAAKDGTERIWIENDLTGQSVIYRSESRSERPIPGGTLRDVREWRIDLTKQPPYQQVIDLVTTDGFGRQRTQ